MSRSGCWENLRATAKDVLREALILTGVALALSVAYIAIRGDWSASQIGSTFQIAGGGVAVIGLFMGYGAFVRRPAGYDYANPTAVLEAAREGGRDRGHALVGMIITVLAGGLLLGLGVVIQVLSGF